MGTPEEVYAQPSTYVAAVLTGHVSFLNATATGDQAQTKLGTVPLRNPTQGECQLVVRPEQVQLDDEGEPMTVTYRRFEGTGYALGLAFQGGTLNGHCTTEGAPQAGDTVRIKIKGTCAAVST